MSDNLLNDFEKIEEKKINKHGKYAAFLDKTNYLAEKYKSALFFIFLQLIVILFLIFGYLSVKANTIVEVNLPKVVKDTDYGKLKIGINTSNKLYYKVWGEYIVNSILNSNTRNINENVLVLKKMLFPEVLKKYSKKIDNLRDFVIKNSASLSYKEYKNSITIKDDGAAVFESKGELNTRFGGYSSKKAICTTRVKMFTKNYMLFVESFQKTCEDIDSNRKE